MADRTESDATLKKEILAVDAPCTFMLGGLFSLPSLRGRSNEREFPLCGHPDVVQRVGRSDCG